jgi:ABC-type transporter Mla subunit MlaD
MLVCCCLGLLFASCFAASAASAAVWTYDVPGGERFSSPDYEVTVESGRIEGLEFSAEPGGDER